MQSALDADGNDNVTAIVLDLRDDSANNAADTATNTTVDIDWNVSKIGDHEDIGNLRKAHCRRCEPFNNTHVPAMAIVDNQIGHFVISAFNLFCRGFSRL